MQLTAANAIDTSSGDTSGEIRTIAGLLVDYDNFQPPQKSPSVSEVRHELLQCLQFLLPDQSDCEFVRIRFYGGWMAGGILSRRGSDVAALLPALDPFPIYRKDGQVVRGSVELATSMLDRSSVVFDDTYRQRGSVPRLRLSGSPLPNGCVSHPDAAACPARILKQFTQSVGRQCPVNECLVTARAAFKVHEQKMVDTLLSCDLLEMAQDSRFKHIAVLSGDTDFVPPMLYARQKSAASLQLIVPGTAGDADYAELLRSEGVDVIEMEIADGYR